MTDITVKILAEVLNIVAIATKEINQSRSSEYTAYVTFILADVGSERFLRKLAGLTDLEDGMKMLDQLTREHVFMSIAQPSVKTSRVLEKKPTVGDAVKSVKGEVQVDDKIAGVDENVTRSSLILSFPTVEPPNAIMGTQIRANLLKWQSPPDPSIDHNFASSYGTAEWFFEEDMFKEWKVSGSLIWVHGKRIFFLPCLTSAN
jgi:hypothetical protein